MRLQRTLLLLGAIAAAAPTSETFSADEPINLPDYEYVVVGSGPGGGTVAARLALAGKRTLLIDAGDDQGENINYQIPALHGKVTEDPLLRWDFFVNHYQDLERQKKDTKMQYRTPNGQVYTGLSPPPGSKPLGILYPRAGTLGGCGSHNALITIYPADSDWDGIAKLTGDDTWGATHMRTYFEKFERNEYLPKGTAGHGFDGWLAVSEAESKSVGSDPQIQQQLEAVGKSTSQRLGQNGTIATFGEDVNVMKAGRDSSTGLYRIPLAMQNAKRNGPRDYIKAVAEAKKADGSKAYPLDVRLNCLVTRILFSNSSSTPRATGVEFLDGKSLYRADPRSAQTGSPGKPGRVSATSEVIIAAGAFNTPQLLKLSGIGPADELKKFNIPVVKNLPGVGTNLQDRYETSIVTRTPSPFRSLKGCTFNNGTADPCITRWKNDQEDHGAYGSNGFAGALVTRSSVANDTNNDLIVFGGPVGFRGYFTGYADAANADDNHFTWAILKAHTGNRAGTVRLRSTDPRDTPQINFNYFDTGTTADGSDERDLNSLVEGMEIARGIYKNLPNGSPTYTEEWPGAHISSKDQLREYAKENAWGHHASCTCPIGADNDPNAVLDAKFRVRGVDSLRVIDASVFPHIPGIFVVVPVYMIGEKGADIILNP